MPKDKNDLTKLYQSSYDANKHPLKWSRNILLKSVDLYTNIFFLIIFQLKESWYIVCRGDNKQSS